MRIMLIILPFVCSFSSHFLLQNAEVGIGDMITLTPSVSPAWCHHFNSVALTIIGAYYQNHAWLYEQLSCAGYTFVTRVVSRDYRYG